MSIWICLLLSTIVICITIVVCTIIEKIRDITDWYEYKNKAYEYDTFKKEYDIRMEQLVKLINEYKNKC